MRFKTDVKKEVLVEFITPEKTLNFLLNSDWKDVFFTFEDLKEIAGYLAYHVVSFESSFGEVDVDGEYQYRRYYYLEGLPVFIRDSNSNLYKMVDEEIGEIHVYVDEDYEVDYIEGDDFEFQ